MWCERRGGIGTGGVTILGCADDSEWQLACWSIYDKEVTEEEVWGRGETISRTLVEIYDMIVVCCGVDAPLRTALARAGVKVGPCIDLARHEVHDMGYIAALLAGLSR